MSCKMQLKGTKFVDLMVLVGFVKMRGARITFHLRAFHCAIDLNFFALRTRTESQEQKYAFSFFSAYFESPQTNFLGASCYSRTHIECITWLQPVII